MTEGAKRRGKRRRFIDAAAPRLPPGSDQTPAKSSVGTGVFSSCCSHMKATPLPPT